MALMAGYTPIASVMLGVLVPIFEPLGVSDPQPDTLLGFSYTPQVSILPPPRGSSQHRPYPFSAPPPHALVVHGASEDQRGGHHKWGMR